jgi:hypothetical protein
MKIYLKAILKPQGRDDVTIDVYPTNPYREFTINTVNICFSPGSNVIQASAEIEGTDEVVEYYKDTARNMPRNDAIEKLKDILYDTGKDVIRYLKYFYGIKELDENLYMADQYEWSLDSTNWNKLSPKYETAWRPSGFLYQLDDNFLHWVPKLVERNIQPFFAFTHLHKAYAEDNTRHQWINATIAAELAFKEFLSQYDVRSATLITYLPAPPLKRLYRDVLKDYTGEESPMYAQLANGAERRNALIHRTDEPTPNRKEALMYIHQVEVAIFHLYTKLYKEDPFFELLFNRSKGRMDWAKENIHKIA